MANFHLIPPPYHFDPARPPSKSLDSGTQGSTGILCLNYRYELDDPTIPSNAPHSLPSPLPHLPRCSCEERGAARADISARQMPMPPTTRTKTY